MALEKELRSSITGATAFGAPNAAEELPVDVPRQPPEEETGPIPEGSPTEAEENAGTEAAGDVLKRVEARLAELSASVEKLGTGDPADTVKESLDRIEKQLASLAQPGPAATAGGMEVLEKLVAQIAEKQDRNDRQLAQDLRENASFRVQVRQGMQRDLDELKAQQSGEQFNPLLKEIAMIYSEYQVLLDEDLSERGRKNLLSLFEQLKDLLADYDAEVIRSEVGSARQTRLCKIINKIPTSDSEKHNTIALSRKPGVMRGRTVLYQEFVDVYVYDPDLAAEESAQAPGVTEDAPRPDEAAELQPQNAERPGNDTVPEPEEGDAPAEEN